MDYIEKLPEKPVEQRQIESEWDDFMAKMIVDLPVSEQGRGFVITDDSYRHFIEYNKLDGVHAQLLEGLLIPGLANLSKVAEKARSLILHARMPDDLADAVFNACNNSLADTDLPVTFSPELHQGDRSIAIGVVHQVIVTTRPELIDVLKHAFAAQYNDDVIRRRLAMGWGDEDVQFTVIVREGVAEVPPATGKVAKIAPDTDATRAAIHSGQAEIQFLDGPQSRWKELLFTFRTFTEMIKGFRALHFAGPCITFFGSARFKPGHEYYELTRQLAGEMAKLGFTIMTGGGPGLMEAANRGAKEVGGRSVGCNIKLPAEQKPNSYLDKWVDIRLFFIRKILLVKYSYAFIVMPGGYGTMDEYFEALTLIQTRKINDFPVVIFCSEYHKELSEHIRLMQKSGAISPKDANLYLITDSIPEVVQLIKRNCIDRYSLAPKKKISPIKWLMERA